MTVAWGLFPASVPDGGQISYPEQESLQRMPQTWSSQAIAALELFLRDVSGGLRRLLDLTLEDEQSRTFHAYHISASDLLGDPLVTADENSGLRKAIEGRVVLIGAAFGHSGDDHHSPVHGQVPGVFLHAMALDNLFRFGDDAWISPPALITNTPTSYPTSQAAYRTAGSEK